MPFKVLSCQSVTLKTYEIDDKFREYELTKKYVIYKLSILISAVWDLILSFCEINEGRLAVKYGLITIYVDFSDIPLALRFPVMCAHLPYHLKVLFGAGILFDNSWNGSPKVAAGSSVGTHIRLSCFSKQNLKSYLKYAIVLSNDVKIENKGDSKNDVVGTIPAGVLSKKFVSAGNYIATRVVQSK